MADFYPQETNDSEIIGKLSSKLIEYQDRSDINLSFVYI